MHAVDRSILRRFARFTVRSAGLSYPALPSPLSSRTILNQGWISALLGTIAQSQWPQQHHYFSSTTLCHRIKPDPPTVTTTTTAEASPQSERPKRGPKRGQPKPPLFQPAWSTAEDEIIRDAIALKLTRDQVLKKVRPLLSNRTHAGIRNRYMTIKGRDRPLLERWTAKEDQIILDTLEDYEGLHKAMDALAATRSVHAITLRRVKLGQNRFLRDKLNWTPEEQQRLWTLVVDQGLRPFEIRSHFKGRSMSAIETRRVEILTETEKKKKKDEEEEEQGTDLIATGGKIVKETPRQYRPWTQEENDRIRGHIYRVKEKEAEASTPTKRFDLRVIASLMFDPEWNRSKSGTAARVRAALNATYSLKSR